MNFYAVLGIPRNADDEAIRRAYRILVRRYHPDLGVGSSAERFRQVREAYETLIDPASRRSYDLSLQPAPHHFAVPIEPTVAQSIPIAVYCWSKKQTVCTAILRITSRFDDLDLEVHFVKENRPEQRFAILREVHARDQGADGQELHRQFVGGGPEGPAHESSAESLAVLCSPRLHQHGRSGSGSASLCPIPCWGR